MSRFILAAAASLALGGCATVTRGTTDQIQLVSEPDGATAKTSLAQQCLTPCTLQVSRKDEFSVTFSKPGFTDQSVQVKTRVAGSGAAGFAGNVLFGGVVGMGVDAATGSTLEHVPNPVSVVLKPAGRPARGKPAPRGRAPAPAPETEETPET